ncbi:hypothetical protein evm_015539, partial [Chilo suppressalis]
MGVALPEKAVFLQQAHLQQWSVIGWVTKNLLSQVPPCFGRHVKLLVPAASAVVSIRQSALGPRGGSWPNLPIPCKGRPISYSQSGGPNSNSRLICEPCISRLRDATDFKRQVQECEKTFTQYLDPGVSSISETEVPIDQLDSQVKVEQVKVEKMASDDDDFDDRTGFDDDDDDDREYSFAFVYLLLVDG